MKMIKTTLSLLVMTSLLFTLPAGFAATQKLSLEDAITLSKENSADIRGVLNQEFTTQNTIRQNIQNSYQLEKSLESYYDYISIYQDASEDKDHPFHKYIGLSTESLTLHLTGLGTDLGEALMSGNTAAAEGIEQIMGFIQAYMIFGDNPSLTKESKYDNFKKNEEMLKNSIELIQTQYDQGLVTATRMTESGVIQLYVALKDLEQGLEVQKKLLTVYEDGLVNMKSSYDQGLVSKLEYDNQIRTVEIERIKTENLQLSYDNYSYQLKKLCGLPMITDLNLSTAFDNGDYSIKSTESYYEQAYDSNTELINMEAQLAYEEKNFAVMDKYLDDYDKNKDFTKPIYHQEKVDQQETIDDLNKQIANKKLLIDANVTQACNDLFYKAKLAGNNERLLKHAAASLNNGIQSFKLGQITQLQLDQLRLEYESAVMTASQNERSYNKSVENFELLLNYGVTYSTGQ